MIDQPKSCECVPVQRGQDMSKIRMARLFIDSGLRYVGCCSKLFRSNSCCRRIWNPRAKHSPWNCDSPSRDGNAAGKHRNTTSRNGNSPRRYSHSSGNNGYSAARIHHAGHNASRERHSTPRKHYASCDNESAES